MARVNVYDDRSALLDAAADAVVDIAIESVAARGRVMFALSGGSTPRGLYERLAATWRERLDWTRVHVFWGDERCVPPTHADSNYRMAREALLDHVPIPPSQIHRMHGEDDPEAAALDYAAILAATLDDAPSGQPGVFDLVLLGLGPDGHTASLFPNGAPGRETRRLVMAASVGAARGWRLTLTPPVLNAARHRLVLVAGADKADALAAVLEGPPNADLLPAQRLTGSDVRWMVDRASAARLTGSPRG